VSLKAARYVCLASCTESSNNLERFHFESKHATAAVLQTAALDTTLNPRDSHD